jgi:hypothetical protein
MPLHHIHDALLHIDAIDKLIMFVEGEVLLKVKAQYGCPLCANQFRSAPFCIVNITYLFFQIGIFNEEVNCTEPSPSVSIPFLQYNHRAILG